ncbi:polyprenol reductase 1-like isoform X2 [Miscanthus floridulus]|uniref:polyprenol reductase 1-like isoform X2 n=1 Tax=Miscanthus floridulus TaxID=154761 RepID=UPI003459F077
MDTGSGPALQYLLCLAWVAATLPIAAAALPIPRAAGGRFIHGLLCTFSSRGKTVRPSSSSSSKAVLRRLYETEHVFHYSPSARMHIIGYLTGIIYYVAAPLSLASSCLPEAIQYLRYQIAEFIVKGRARMPDLAIDPSHLLKPLLKLGWCQWIGAVIFIWGSLHQIHCHAILGSLREHKDSDEYVIPCGDWFSRVSCPHYLAELVIYCGMLIASGGSDISVWFLYLFVITNLSFAAVQTHKWYLQKFEDYPRSRYAIIPFVC